MATASQDFTQIAIPGIKNVVRLALNGINTGIIGHSKKNLNVEGDKLIVNNMYKPIKCFEKTSKGQTTPTTNADLEQRIIYPRALHTSVVTDWQEVQKLTHNPKGPLTQLIIASLKEGMEKIAVEQAFGRNNIGPYTSGSTVPFDTDMVVKLNDKVVNSSATNTSADKLILAASKLQSNGVIINSGPDGSNIVLFMTSGAYTSLFGDVRMISKEYVHLANMENGQITHFAGFKVVISDYLPGGSKQPLNRNSTTGAENTGSPAISIPATGGVKSYALFMDRNALETAIWKDINIQYDKLAMESFSDILYGSCMVGVTRTEEKRIGYIEMPA